MQLTDRKISFQYEYGYKVHKNDILEHISLM